MGRAGDDPEAWLADARRTLTILLEEFPGHFGREEGGLYQTVPAENPRFARRLGELEREHPELLEMLRGAADCAASCTEPNPDGLRDLAERCRGFIASLRRHEGAENEIIAQATWEDLGVGD